MLGAAAAIPAALTVAPATHAELAAAYPSYDLVTDFGADPSGLLNSTKALYAAAKQIERDGGGTLTIPRGTYTVGIEARKPRTPFPGVDPDDLRPGNPYWLAHPLFAARDLAFLQINGYGATLRLAVGMHWGGFDPITGAVVDHDGRNQDYAAAPGRMIELRNCDNVWIRGLHLHGNNENLQVGGQWGDIHIQAAATGFWFFESTRVTLSEVHTDHHGLDGIGINWVTDPDPAVRGVTVNDSQAHYNGRQGLSWIGGSTLTCNRSSFSHTGRGAVFSNPSAGIDIEPEDNTKVHTGTFTDCDFIDNKGAGVHLHPKARHEGERHTFTRCLFWGTETGGVRSYYSVVVWRPGAHFVDCEIRGTGLGGYGSTNPAVATAFEGCHFEDLAWTNGTVYRNGYLYVVRDPEGDDPHPLGGTRFDRCTFTNYRVRSLKSTSTPIGTQYRVVLHQCTFHHRFANLSSGLEQAELHNVRIESCRFEEDGLPTTRHYGIKVSNAWVTTPAGLPRTWVEGSQVHWLRPRSGLTGFLTDDTYTS